MKEKEEEIRNEELGKKRAGGRRKRKRSRERIGG